jgi:hypothetical protein
MLSKQGIVELLKTNDKAIARALVVLNERQTKDEQAAEHTRYHNGLGFRPCHARMGTSMAKFFERRGYLTDKQIAYWRRPMKGGKMKIEIYAGQLLEAAKLKAAGAVAVTLPPRAAAPVNSYMNASLDHLMELRMVLQEQYTDLLESDDASVYGPVKEQLEKVDNAIATIHMQDEKKMQRLEAEGDRNQTREEELKKFLMRCQMEAV